MNEKKIIPVIMNWIFAEGNPPEIDLDDKSNTEDMLSKEVLTISDYGIKRGCFHHRSGNWSLEGVYTSKKIMPKYWAYLVLPNE